ncbi:MAG: c(7)-type cytochrome triheme domain-containing protein [Elusimicrobiota bacterium]|jgi:c(7)-type cytochrome triheme protein
MRKFWSLFVITGALAAAFVFAGSANAEDAKKKEEPAKAEAKGEAKETPEVINFDKAKLGNVAFPHKKHVEMMEGKCDACHSEKEPLFAQKKSEALKMADMKAGKSCGFCHDGKKKQGDKVIFASTACMKCHKKEAAKK